MTQPCMRGSGFEKHDDYMTPKYAWENIQQFIPKDKVIWEAFYGDGNSGNYLKELGFNVIHEEVDFFETDLGEIIVSNPPFSKSKEVMKRMKELDKPFILIAPPRAFTTKKFQNLFKQHLQLIIPNKRPTFTKLNEESEGYTPPFGIWYFCYKLNLEKDLNFI